MMELSFNLLVSVFICFQIDSQPIRKIPAMMKTARKVVLIPAMMKTLLKAYSKDLKVKTIIGIVVIANLEIFTMR
jgi:hypothetical protein